MLASAMNDNLKNCSFVVLNCPEQCGGKIRREEMQRHLVGPCLKRQQQVERINRQIVVCDTLNPVWRRKLCSLTAKDGCFQWRDPY
jgi:hypothetical protein